METDGQAVGGQSVETICEKEFAEETRDANGGEVSLRRALTARPPDRLTAYCAAGNPSPSACRIAVTE